MRSPFTHLLQRQLEQWLIIPDRNSTNNLNHALILTELAQTKYQQLTQLLANSHHQATPQLLSTINPIEFLATFIATIAAQIPLFLLNPQWTNEEYQKVLAMVESNSLGSYPTRANIMIPTGGSSGEIRFAIHTWQTLTTAVTGFQQYFQTETINSFCLLPLYHVSGLMQFVRSLTSNGKIVIMPFQDLMQGQKCEINPATFFISLVPTQLQKILANPELTKWLSQFHTVLLGGAPAWPELLTQARQLNIRLAPTYGMTETAAQIATLKPDNFLAGNSSSGQILPHAIVEIIDDNQHILGVNQIGNIRVKSAALALGYYPAQAATEFGQHLITDDRGYLDELGYLYIVGRSSEKIITGGENVFPAEVEAAILGTGLVADVRVMGKSDRLWGEAIVAFYVPINSTINLTEIQTLIANKLTKFKQPKYWIKLDQIPRNQQGKVDRQALEKLEIWQGY